MRFRLAVGLQSLELPIREAFLAAARMKVGGVQVDLSRQLNPLELTASGIRDIRHLLTELNLTFASGTLPLKRPLYEEERLDERLAAIRRAMEFAYQLGVPLLCFRAGRLPEVESPEYGLLVEVLNDLARHANHVGTQLALTPTNDSATAMLELVARVNTGPLGMDFDPAASVMRSESPIEGLQTCHAIIRHVQLRDGLREIDGRGQEVPVGQGRVPWLEVLATLGEIGYHGWLTATRGTSIDPLGDLQQAIAGVRRIAPLP